MPLINRETLRENKAIIIFLVVVAIILILALIGWLSGAWEASPTAAHRSVPPYAVRNLK